MNPLVSVYLPTRNRRRLLERAIASVLRQTYEPIELIVVNDASTDGTRGYLDELAAREPSVVVVHSDSAVGAPAARNRAINMATGQFITGLDDDDEFCEDRISLFVSYWNRLGDDAKQVACLFSKSITTDGVTHQIASDRKDWVKFTDLFRHNYIGNHIFCPTERLVSIGGFDERMPAWQDLELFMRLVRHYGQARLIPKATYKCYVDDRERISKDSRRIRNAYDIIASKYGHLSPALNLQLFLQIFSSYYGILPSASDWRKVLAAGAPPKLILRLFRATIVNYLRASSKWMRGRARHVSVLLNT
jgi:glycosyltransferase involved in cell wall biosynthesis